MASPSPLSPRLLTLVETMGLLALLRLRRQVPHLGLLLHPQQPVPRHLLALALAVLVPLVRRKWLDQGLWLRLQWGQRYLFFKLGGSVRPVLR